MEKVKARRFFFHSRVLKTKRNSLKIRLRGTRDSSLHCYLPDRIFLIWNFVSFVITL